MLDAAHTSALAGSQKYTLERLVAPLTLDVFMEEYWDQKLLIKRGADAHSFDDLFRIDELDCLFNTSAPNGADWFFFRGVNDVDRSQFCNLAGHVQLNAIRSLYREGGTIHLRNIQSYMPRVDLFWRQAQEMFKTRVNLNAWLTSQNDIDPFLHYDTHGIFIMQVTGRKHWTIYNRHPEFFAPRSPSSDLRPDQVGEPLHDIIIEPGDLLYMPAGTPHSVATLDPHALHIAFGVHGVVWHDILDCAVAEAKLRGGDLNRLVPRAMLADPVALRRGLISVLPAMAEEADCDKIVRLMADRFRESCMPPRDTHFVDTLMAEETVAADTPLRRRDALPAEVRQGDSAESCALVFSGGGGMEMGGELASILREIASATPGFTANDLSDEYDIGSRTLLVGELVHRGFLERAD